MQLTKGINFAGNGLIVLDAGLRANAVHNSYLSKEDWQREFSVQTAGFGFGAAIGITVGRTTTALTTSALTAGLTAIGLTLGPVGWIVIIGTSVAVGYYAGKQADAAAQKISGSIYDRDFSRSQ